MIGVLFFHCISALGAVPPKKRSAACASLIEVLRPLSPEENAGGDCPAVSGC